MNRAMKHHALPIRVYYEDTDAGGIVYHSNYFKFAERGRTEMLRDLDMSIQIVLDNHHIMFVMRHAEIEYFAPARLEDMLELRTCLSEIKNSSFIMHQTVLKDGVMLADIHATLVCLDERTFKPVRMPEAMRDAFKDYLEEEAN